MNPAKKRQIRLVVALSTAVLLAVALIYTSFSAANDAIEPSQLIENPNGTYDVTGKVAMDSVERSELLRFEITNRDGSDGVPVEYEGQIPDPFREGREVIITGALDDSGTLIAEKDSLVTKCPSKFKEEYGDDPNIEYEE
ncbi:MAG TPA: cytochrome c maturation protein CcmE [Solirubrobacterales bacterium]|nr:cytochrome c maturation protein CcmE [Solirubrobacterales bacterium]